MKAKQQAPGKGRKRNKSKSFRDTLFLNCDNERTREEGGRFGVGFCGGLGFYSQGVKSSSISY